MPDYTIRELQTKLPWTIRYSQDFRSNPQTHKDFAHALHHVSKAAGKLHALADDMDHGRAVADSKLQAQHGKYVADLVVCALRLANTFPGGTLDLQQGVQDRIEGKNEVRLGPGEIREFEFQPYFFAHGQRVMTPDGPGAVDRLRDAGNLKVSNEWWVDLDDGIRRWYDGKNLRPVSRVDLQGPLT